jgi:hypothetical protein
MSEPNIIVGPAIIQHNGATFYTEGNITEKLTRKTRQPNTAMYGPLGARLVSQMVELSFTPVGEIKDADKYFPYTLADIGSNIYDLPSDKTVTIWTKAGQKIVYAEGAVRKMPQLNLGVQKEWLGDMSIGVKANRTVEYTDAAAWSTITASAFTDASFDSSLIKTGRYLVSWAGDGVNKLVNEGTQDGVTISYEMGLAEKAPDGYNVVAEIITSLKAVVRFKPLSLTEEQLQNLIALQGANAILPGERLSKFNQDMTVESTTAGLKVVVNKVGPMDMSRLYGLAEYRQGEIAFESEITLQAGVPDPLITLTIS